MTVAIIEVDRLAKQFKVPVREQGLRASVRSLFHRQHRLVDAVGGVSFTIEPGEIVGFLGPNGAGKTTTLKMLSGILSPSTGSARVLGFEPFRRDADFLRRITLVMGNRSQLEWDLPAADSFVLQQAIYGLEPADAKQTRDELIELLDLGALIDKPVRNLSLGERMKMEVALSLLHRPDVLFLDEPTLGLDVTMQRRIRSFLREHNAHTGATVLLTSHYMADVEALCQRVIVIHHGHLLFDGELADLAARSVAHKTVTVEFTDAVTVRDRLVAEIVAAAPGTEVAATTDASVTLRVQRSDVPRVAAMALAELDVVDLAVEDPPIDDVIEQVFDVPVGEAIG
jgi:viologen exporter family transport system ATP-binding protein